MVDTRLFLCNRNIEDIEDKMIGLHALLKCGEGAYNVEMIAYAAMLPLYVRLLILQKAGPGFGPFS